MKLIPFFLLTSILATPVKLNSKKTAKAVALASSLWSANSFVPPTSSSTHLKLSTTSHPTSVMYERPPWWEEESEWLDVDDDTQISLGRLKRYVEAKKLAIKMYAESEIRNGNDRIIENPLKEEAEWTESLKRERNLLNEKMVQLSENRTEQLHKVGELLTEGLQSLHSLPQKVNLEDLIVTVWKTTLQVITVSGKLFVGYAVLKVLLIVLTWSDEGLNTLVHWLIEWASMQ